MLFHLSASFSEIVGCPVVLSRLHLTKKSSFSKVPGWASALRRELSLGRRNFPRMVLRETSPRQAQYWASA